MLKTVYMICHSHLDIGYTHTISDIDNRYYHFIQNLLKYQINGYDDYKYSIECYYTFEKFLERATTEEKSLIFEQIKKGKIDIGASYLNFTDTLHPEIYSNLVRTASNELKKNGCSLKSAFFSDVNGFNPGYAMGLVENGIDNLMANVHSGHGIFPLESKLSPFWWELPNGEKLFVYNSDLYTLGNEFGFTPKGSFSDVYDDEVEAKKYNFTADENQWMELTKYRMKKLKAHLTDVSFKYDFIAMGLHGTDDDNAIPNPYIIDRIKKWNKDNDLGIEVKQVTLTEFFEEIKTKYNYPIYTGDFADFWSDGVGCAVEDFKIFKELQTEYLFYKHHVGNEREHNQVERYFANFAEHTFNHMWGVDDPFLKSGQHIAYQKASNIGNLVKHVEDLKYKYFDFHGCSAYQVEVTNNFKVINPANIQYTGVITLRFDKFDLYTYPEPYIITDEHNNTYEYFAEYEDEARCNVIRVPISLAANEYKVLSVNSHENEDYVLSTIEDAFKVHAPVGYERLPDIAPISLGRRVYEYDHVFIDENNIYTKNLHIKYNKNGIYSIYDLKEGVELLNTELDGLAQPIFEVNVDKRNYNVYSEVSGKYFRSSRVRKTLTTERFYGEVDYVDVLSDNEYYCEILMSFKLDHFKKYDAIYKIDKCVSKINVKINTTKELVEKHHNLLISFPFIKKQADELHLDRGGYLLETYKDCLPHSLTEYNTVYGGAFISREDLNINVTMANSFLVHLKNVENNVAHLMHDDILEYVEKRLFAMPICHQWGVNFYPFKSNHICLDYTIEWGNVSKSELFERNKQNTIGIQVIKVK